MNESLMSGAGVGGGRVARRDFLRRPVVDGSQGVSSQRPALWFFGSLLLRTSIALAGFYFVSGGHWERLLAVPPWIYHGAPRRDAADPTPAEQPSSPGTGGQPCTLVPTRSSSGSTGFSNSTPPLCSRGD